MSQVAECVCCKEISATTAKLNELAPSPPPPCITLHPGFNTVCLDRWVLQAALYSFKQHYTHYYHGPLHE